MKIRFLRFFAAVMAAALLICSVTVLGGCSEEKPDVPDENTPMITWKADGLFAIVPPPTKAYGRILTDTKEFIEFETYYVEKTDFSLYVQLCTEKGYTYSVINSEFFYSATNSEGYKLSVHFNERQKTLKVSLDATRIKLKITVGDDYFVGLQQDDAMDILRATGFSNITVKITEIPDDYEHLNGEVESVRINSLPFEANSEFSKTDPVVVRYYMRAIALETVTSELVEKSYAEVEAILRGFGFINITCKESIVPVGSALPESLHGSVFAVSVNGRNDFERGEKFSPNAAITVNYYSFNIIMDVSAESMRYQEPEGLADSLRAKGFKNVKLEITHNVSGVDMSTYDGKVASVSIGGNSTFVAGQVFERSASVIITYYQYNIEIGISATEMMGYMDYKEAEAYLKELGFTNVTTHKGQQLFNGWVHSEGEISGINVGGKAGNFSAGTTYPYDTQINILYYFFP